MADRKNRPTDNGVKAFLDGVSDPKRKADCMALLKLMRALTGAEPVLWGASTIGFGTFTSFSPGGRKSQTYLIGFSPRKKDLSVYVSPSLVGSADLLSKLGPHKLGKTCVYLTALSDVDAKVLKELLTRAVNGTANGST